MLHFSTTKTTNSPRIVGRAYNSDKTLKGLLVKEKRVEIFHSTLIFLL